MDVSKTEVGRKRVAKLLGLAPYRVEVVTLPTGELGIQVDGGPVSEEQNKVIFKDAENILRQALSSLN